MTYIGTSKATAKTFLTLEAELTEVHAGKYTYENAQFFNARTPMAITCPEHGTFMQRPRGHRAGKGCRKCYDARGAVFRRKSQEQVEKELEVAIGEIFEVLPFVYTTSHGNVDLLCKTCGYTKTVKVCSALAMRNGCPTCVNINKSWGPSPYEGKRTTLYYLKIGEVYKIGITKKSVASRYVKELREGLQIEIVFTVEFENGAEAFKEEKRILKEFVMYKYIGVPVLSSGGNSELFTCDIFNLGGVPSIL